MKETKIPAVSATLGAKIRAVADAYEEKVTCGRLAHDLTCWNIGMRGVTNPTASSPCLTNHTTETFVDARYLGLVIPDLTKIELENIYNETRWNVLIAGLEEKQRTQIVLRHVVANGITKTQTYRSSRMSLPLRRDRLFVQG